MDNSNILESKTAGGVIISACGLWVHLALLSLVMLVLCLYLSKNLTVPAIILFLLCQFECLRLNLDNRLFKEFYENPNEIEKFDIGLMVLFNKKKNNRTLEDRWKGTKKILRNAIFWLFMQIAIVFTSCFVF